MFKFQDKDFREEKKRVQAILLEQQAEAAKNAQPGGRFKRSAALAAIDSSQSFHNLIRKGKVPQESSEYVPDIAKPKKDNSISVLKKHFEYQFFPDLQRITEVSMKIQKMQDNFEEVPAELKEDYAEMLSQGFYDWT